MIWGVVIVAALGGAFVRAVASEQPTWTWPVVVDTAMGGFASVAVWLVLSVAPWTSATVAKLDTPAEQAVSVAVLSYIGSHVWTNRGAEWLAALGDKITGRAGK